MRRVLLALSLTMGAAALALALASAAMAEPEPKHPCPNVARILKRYGGNLSEPKTEQRFLRAMFRCAAKHARNGELRMSHAIASYGVGVIYFGHPELFNGKGE
jgi:hypothetical protein